MTVTKPLALPLLALCVAGLNAVASTAIVVSVPDQKLALVRDGERVAQYKISTSRFGVGDKPSSFSTPLGNLEVAARVGGGLPAGAVLKGRRPTGEILSVNAAGRDPIVTRILHLRGLEPGNKNAHSRGIYIHGTPVERMLGRPDSWGCIRMRSADVIALFDLAPVGTRVEILNNPLSALVASARVSTRPNLPVVAEAPAKVEALKPAKVATLNPVPPKATAVLAKSPTPARAAARLPGKLAGGNMQALHGADSGRHTVAALSLKLR